MDLIRIGEFLRELRKEKGLTQEQFSEIVNVSNRTISRWENGNNLPELDVLIEIADFYEVDLRDILDGERKSENMKKEIEEAVLKSAEYKNLQTERFAKRVRMIFLASAVLWFLSQVINHTALNETAALSSAAAFAEGTAVGLALCGFLTAGSFGQKLRAFKQRILKKEK